MAASDPVELEGWALRFVSGALAREVPFFAGKSAQLKLGELRQKYFKLHRIIEVAGGGLTRAFHIAYRPDTSSIFVLSGRQQCIRLLASIDPVVFQAADEVLAFSGFADRVTSDDPAPVVAVESADELEKAGKVLNGGLDRLRAIQEKFRERVQPHEQSVLPFGFQERYHLVCGEKLIERTRTIASGGIFWRHDEILSSELPFTPSGH
jgi:hypothetical protein